MDRSSQKTIAVAHLLRPQGRRGELLADLLTDLPGIFVEGRSLWCTAAPTPPGQRASPAPDSLTLESVWSPTGRNAGRLVLKLSGVDSISAAEQLAGADLLLDEGALPPRDPDTFLVRDLLGCTLYDAGQAVGEIVDLEFPVAPDGRTRLQDAAPFLLVRLLTSPGVEPIMVPFIKAWLQSVDLEARAVRMTLPEGLLEVSADTAD